MARLKDKLVECVAINMAKEKYGDLAGLAQQYLFYWRREQGA